jgi:nitroimidazol reductase NimA-like FMN-containing flavoprotein (pyridoxamine 5'-phosphate oxidase superfamily)
MEVLTRSECDELLSTTSVGRVAFVSDGDLVILPVNFRLFEGTIVFRSSAGSKLEAAARWARVAFEVDGWDEESRTGWSVVVKGIAVEVMSESEAGRLAELDLRPWADAVDRRSWVRIRPDEITGRKIR